MERDGPPARWRADVRSVSAAGGWMRGMRLQSPSAGDRSGGEGPALPEPRRRAQPPEATFSFPPLRYPRHHHVAALPSTQSTESWSSSDGPHVDYQAESHEDDLSSDDGHSEAHAGSLSPREGGERDEGVPAVLVPGPGAFLMLSAAIDRERDLLDQQGRQQRARQGSIRRGSAWARYKRTVCRMLEMLCLTSAVLLLGLLIALHVHTLNHSACIPTRDLRTASPDMLEIRVVGVWSQFAERLRSELQQQLARLDGDHSPAAPEGPPPGTSPAWWSQACENPWTWVSGLASGRRRTERARGPVAPVPMDDRWKLPLWWRGSAASDEQHDGGSAREPPAVGWLAAVGGRVRASFKRAVGGLGSSSQSGGGGMGKGVYGEEEDTVAMAAARGAVLLRELTQDDAAVLAVALDELDALIQVPLYVFSANKGFILLSEGVLDRHRVSRYNLTLSSADACFTGGGDGGDGVAGTGTTGWRGSLVPRILSYALEYVIGYDTVIINQLVVMLASEVGREAAQGLTASRPAVPARGVLGSGSDDGGGGRRATVLAAHVGDLYNLNISERRSVMWWDVLLRKLWVVCNAAFVVATTSALVSFTLRETHVRVLRLSLQLRLQRHRDVPLQQLLMHLGSSMSFIPIIVGVLMFLFEFFDDQMLAFAVFALVWAAEIFCMLCVRGAPSGAMLKFAPLFLLTFVLFLLYVFSFPLGFTYVAFAVWLASSAAAMLYFTNHVLPLASSTPDDLSYTTVPTPGLVSVWVTQT